MQPPRVQFGAAILLLGAVLPGAVARAQPGAPIPTDELVNRATAYALRLKQQLAVVIADERYVQHAAAMRRDIRSEMLFLWLEDDHFWVSIRNVLEVDGRKVPDSAERLARILKDPSPGAYARLRAVQAEGARFNIGSVVRTTNTPTLVLQFLLPETRSRFDFSEAGRQGIHGTPTSRIAFAERAAPTIVEHNGRPALSHGWIWLSDDGTVVRTELLIDGGPGSGVTATVDFAPDARLGVWVPARMQERYETGGAARTTCTATYSNYRRFETSARILPPRSHRPDP